MMANKIIIPGYKKTYRKAVFIVVYRIDSKTKKPLYILLKRKLHWRGWEFPKGGIDKGESALQTVKREVKEETGQFPLRIKKFNIKGKYPYQKILNDRPDILGQSYILFSAEINPGKIKIDKKEHSGYIWIDFEKAVKRLSWPNQKRCLKIVNKTLRI